MKKAVVVCNGNLNKKYLYAHIKKDDFIIAVDGGANKLVDTIFEPDLIIGDMDSINRQAEKKFRKVNQMKFPVEKDKIDLELAIDYCVEKKFREIVFLGSVGSRVDMNLTNVFLLEKIPEKINAKIIHLNQEIFLIRKKKIISGKPGEKISLFPIKQEVEGLTLDGFRYEVKNFDLDFGIGMGLSNEFKKKKGIISFKSGLILCVHFREGLYF